MLDKLPAQVRHLAIIAFTTFGGVIVTAIFAAQGVTDVLWSSTLLTAVNVTAVALAAGASALYLTPLTRQYGWGSDGKLNGTEK